MAESTRNSATHKDILHIYIRTCICAHKHTYIHTYVHTCTQTYIHTHIHTYTYVHTCTQTYIHIRTHVYMYHTNTNSETTQHTTRGQEEKSNGKQKHGWDEITKKRGRVRERKRERKRERERERERERGREGERDSRMSSGEYQSGMTSPSTSSPKIWPLCNTTPPTRRRKTREVDRHSRKGQQTVCERKRTHTLTHTHAHTHRHTHTHTHAHTHSDTHARKHTHTHTHTARHTHSHTHTRRKHTRTRPHTHTHTHTHTHKHTHKHTQYHTWPQSATGPSTPTRHAPLRSTTLWRSPVNRYRTPAQCQ